MPVASAISTHSVQVSHHPGAKGIGRGQRGVNGSGSESAPNFGEVLRGQAGVVAQPILSGATAKQAGQSGGKASGQTEEMAEVKAGGLVSQQAHGSAGQINEAMKAKAAAQVDSPSAQLQALSKVGAQSAEADNVQAATTGAAELKALEKVERDDHAKLSPPGADAGDGKAVKAKSGKGGKADEAGKAGKSIAEKPPQVTVQVAALATSAAAPVAAPVLPLLEKSVKAESVLPSRAANTTVPLAKSPSGRQVPQTKTAAAGKIQGLADSAALPMPNASSAPESAQAMAGDLTGDADSERLPGVKSSGKQDSSASAAKTGSEIASQAKHLNSPAPNTIHSTQVAQAAMGGPGEGAAHISASPQNFAPVSIPAVGTLHGASIGAASPYDRIDQGTAPVVLHAGAQQVAVGVHDPSLGWVEIKTQSAAGHVDATLVASSGQTRDALAAQLPAISQFLEQRDVRVGTLVVNHQSAGSGANHFGNGSGGGAGTHHAGQGYGGNGASGGNGGNNGSQRHAPRYNAPAPARHAVPVTGAGGESSSTARPLSYISVRA